MASLMRVESLNFSWNKQRPILRSLFLDIPDNRTLGIVGRNGSGTSTLFKCLTERTDFTGSLFYRDRYLEPTERMRHIAWMPQDSCLPPGLGVRTLLVRCGCGGHPLVAADPRLPGLMHKRVAMLSPGERRYLEFLLVMSLEKPLTILDEPFSQVEPIFITAMFDIIKKRPAGHSVLISDHNFVAVRECCDELWLLHEGQFLAADRLEVLASHDYLSL